MGEPRGSRRADRTLEGFRHARDRNSRVTSAAGCSHGFAIENAAGCWNQPEAWAVTFFVKNERWRAVHSPGFAH
jgi:hypothetical protein